MIRINESNDYTNFIDNKLPKEVSKFMTSTDLDNKTVKDAINAYKQELNKFPSFSSIDLLDIKYDQDKKRFYIKYRPFIDKCKELIKTKNPSGYGRTDYFDLKIRDMLKSVEYNFPYGWKN